MKISNNHMSHLSRRQFVALSVGALAGLALPRGDCAEARNKVVFPQLDRVGSQFSIALLADTHFGALDAGAANVRGNIASFRRAAAEINALQPAPAFVLHIGDIIANPSPSHVEAAKTLLRELKPLTVLTHGNHDGREPWPEFQEMQQAVNGTREVRFSFDCGPWHFVVIPCNHRPEGGYPDELVAWLKADLAANRQRPTMVFAHLHLLPQGLTQLEFYTYDKPLRTRLLHTLAEAGNVRWVFCGHVHNGIQAAAKTAWSWRGIRFLTAPTIVPPRNFGEEFPAFAAGEPGERNHGGGYYSLIDVDGEQVRVRSRLGGVKEEYAYPDTVFRPYANQEPLWFDNITDLPAETSLRNGSFEDGLAGWRWPYRYLSDREPGFIWKADSTIAKTGRQAAHLFVREKGQTWARDEITELYQWIQWPTGGPVAIRVAYFVDNPDVGGGGYLRFTAFSGQQPKLTCLLDWGKGDRGTNMRMAAHAQFMATGEKVNGTELIKLGRSRQALFWRLDAEPKRWHEVRLLLSRAYDQALGQPGAFERLRVDRLLVALGVWCHSNRGSQSSAWFDDVAVETLAAPSSDLPALTLNGKSLPVDARVFETDFGATLRASDEEKAGKQAKRKAKRA